MVWMVSLCFQDLSFAVGVLCGVVLCAGVVFRERQFVCGCSKQGGLNVKTKNPNN